MMKMFNREEHYYIRSEPSDYQHMGCSVSKIIKKLKMNLMSRNIKKQVQAINNILNIIKSKTSKVTGQILIGVDIPGLLCDVMNNHNPVLIEKVFFCLLELSKDEEFYKQKHSTVVVETTCRTIKIFASEGNNGPTIHKGIELLVKILSRCDREVTINLYQVMGIVSDVLGSSIFQGVHLAAMSLLKIILQTEDFDHKDLPDLVYLTLTLLFKLRRNNVNRLTKHSKLALQIMKSSLRYFSTHPDMPLTQKSFSVVWSLIKSFVIPSIKELDVNKCGPNIVMKMLYCILTAYDCLDEKKLNLLSNHLAAEGYLTLLPDLDQHFANKAVHKCVSNILYHILARLAHSELKFPMRGCQLIGEGLDKLPADSVEWPDLLAKAQPECVHLAIIIHLYFVLLCDCRDSLVNSNTQLPALCKFLMSQRSPPSSTILKATSFVFAVLSLSCPQSVEGLQRELLLATRKLVQWLKCTILGKVFTHHHAMLYWFFSAQVNDKILQMHAIALWMKDNSPTSCKELKDLVLKIDEAALRVLDVLNCCSENLLMGVISLLKVVLARDKREKRLETSVYIWWNLSSTLSCLSTPGWEKRLKNVCCVIFLACKVVPHSPDVTLMLRLTQQLVRTFQKTCGKSWEETLSNTRNTEIQLLLAQLFKLTHTIICKMNQAKDYRGLKIFLDEDSLRRGLLAILDSDNKLFIHPALKLLTYLQHSQKLYNIQIRNRGTVMGAEFLLQLMNTERADTAFFAANLFSNLRVLDPKVFITLSNDMSITTIHTLYLEFLNLSVRHSVVSSLSWRCGSMLLQYCHHHNREMEEQLLNFPLNNIALRVAFKKNGIRDTHVAEYLLVYVKGVRSHKLVSHHSYSKACSDPISAILTITAEQLLTRDWPTDSLHSQLLYQICTIGGNIPLQTIKALKLKIPRRYNKVGHKSKMLVT